LSLHFAAIAVFYGHSFSSSVLHRQGHGLPPLDEKCTIALSQDANVFILC
jgi:hypothetical protein